ncbi:MAG: hypothetical protein UX61_C0022G0008 [Parcubacteria group bacterium GW2011_GWA2_46_7]|nr:MAG: hypothetical protein UX15_C0037G0005 [Parcubacteria group bacterium GW2011_GWA1_45_7]KKU43380.1 MAG: hypothetical protein UX61_C0022G0008 [Parcubacteria group bacterium GW2011_GWA2_46_7]
MIFGPEFALLLFVVLLIFFVSITFHYHWVATSFFVLYFWRLGIELINRVMSFGVGPYLLEYMGLEENIRWTAIIKIGCSVLLLPILYVLVSRSSVMRFSPSHWFISFLFNLTLSGFFISSILVFMAAELPEGFSAFMQNLFIHPYAQVLWASLPFLVLGVSVLWPQKLLKKFIKLS